MGLRLDAGDPTRDPLAPCRAGFRGKSRGGAGRRAWSALMCRCREKNLATDRSQVRAPAPPPRPPRSPGDYSSQSRWEMDAKAGERPQPRPMVSNAHLCRVCSTLLAMIRRPIKPFVAFGGPPEDLPPGLVRRRDRSHLAQAFHMKRCLRASAAITTILATLDATPSANAGL